MRLAREGAGLTQGGLADAAGMARDHLVRIELGGVNPTVATLYAVCDVLNVRVAELLPD